MIYTVIADDVAQVGKRVLGLGVYADQMYHGHVCWYSFNDALRYLRSCPDLERFRVWGLSGSWERDTYQYGFEPFRRTLRDLAIVRPL